MNTKTILLEKKDFEILKKLKEKYGISENAVFRMLLREKSEKNDT